MGYWWFPHLNLCSLIKCICIYVFILFFYFFCIDTNWWILTVFVLQLVIWWSSNSLYLSLWLFVFPHCLFLSHKVFDKMPRWNLYNLLDLKLMHTVYYVTMRICWEIKKKWLSSGMCIYEQIKWRKRKKTELQRRRWEIILIFCRFNTSQLHIIYFLIFSSLSHPFL